MHSFIQNVDYNGPFIPGFIKSPFYEPFNELIEQPDFLKIDHVAANQGPLDMVPTAEWYEKMLDFHQYYSIDYNTLHTEFSALRSTIVTDFDEIIKFALAEPADGRRKS